MSKLNLYGWLTVAVTHNEPIHQIHNGDITKV